MGEEFKVIIIGSGLAGSLLANGLIASQIEVSIYDRLQQHGRREGYQIRLGAPALIGMRACLSPDQIKNIAAKFGRAGGLKSAAPVVYDEAFRPLIDLTRFPAYSKSAAINRAVLRDALAEPVFEAGKLTYARSFASFEISKPGTSKEMVRVWFDDGSFDDCDILIGADGSHSKINKQLGLNNLHQLNTHLSMISKCDLPTEKFLKLSPALQRAPSLTFAQDKTLYFAAYLPDKIIANNTMGKNYGGEDFEFDDKMSSCMFGWHIPLTSAPKNAFELSTDEKWEQLVVRNFEGWAKEYHEVVDLVKGSDLYVYKARVSEYSKKNWRHKVRSAQEPEKGHHRVWLMGDAMHAMLPNRGMGGNQSMRDTATALPLLQRLAEIKDAAGEISENAIASACKEFEDEMIPRGMEWVQKSGGSKIVPFDSSTLKGKIFFFIAGYTLNLAYVWTKLVGLFKSDKIVDDAPELRD